MNPSSFGAPRRVGPAECADPVFIPKREFFPSVSEGIRHAHRTTRGGLADLIASRIPPGQVECLKQNNPRGSTNVSTRHWPSILFKPESTANLNLDPKKVSVISPFPVVENLFLSTSMEVDMFCMSLLAHLQAVCPSRQCRHQHLVGIMRNLRTGVAHEVILIIKY